MKIEEYELDEKDAIQANCIISDFINYTCQVIDGGAHGMGRSILEDKQYRLNIDNQRYASVKLRYDKNTSHRVELVVNEIRHKLKLPNYDIKRISGFPMNGDKWRQGDCLLIDWGVQNTRIDLAHLEPSSLSEEEKNIFLKDLARNAALSCALGLWDRNIRNFVWDKADKKLISIDHESFSIKDVDMKIFREIANIMIKFFGTKWHIDKTRKTIFTEIFLKTWHDIDEIKTEIFKIFKKHQCYTTGLIPRIEKGPVAPLKIITRQSIYS